MNKLEIIEFAMLETLKKHPSYVETADQILYRNMVRKEGINYLNFTSTNDARKKMGVIEQDDLIQFVLEEVVKLFNAIANYYYDDKTINSLPTVNEKMEELMKVFPNYPEIRSAVEIIANRKINSMIYFKTNTKDLLAITTAVANSRYQRGQELREYIDYYGVEKTNINEHKEADLFSKIRDDIRKASIGKNVVINQRNINKCLADLLSGAQLKNKHNSYGLDGTLYASQDMGNRRANQEDTVVILTHPKIPEFKMLLVSDGMGGVELGEKASLETAKGLARWFECLPENLFDSPKEVETLLKRQISVISDKVYKQYNQDYREIRAGATVVAAVVGKSETVVASVGDSRAYTMKDGRLQLQTRDESAVWPPERRAGTITKKELDDLRFATGNNVIARCIGQDLTDRIVQSLRIKNDAYDQLLLMTDGVTDLLSQDRIRIISNTYPPEQIAEMLVNEAISKNAIREQGEDEYHNAMVAAGKDNATAAVYHRR